MRKITKKTAAPLIIALALVFAGAVGSFALTSSGMLESEDYRAQFYLNHLQVHLIENDRDVCGGENTLGSDKVSGELVQYLGYSRDGDTEKLGSVEPGKLYKEEVKARNGQDIPIYVRMTIKKFWMITDENGNPVEKATNLSPDKIKLSYGKKEYNSGDWFLNKSESTAEQKTYYCRSQVAANGDSPLLFDGLKIDNLVMKRTEASREKNEETGVTTITYKYDYDGYAFFIKADVQALQTHNATDAIHSQWGIYDVVEKDGVLKPAQ